MKISIITLFPEMFEDILNSSILKRAQQKGLVEFNLVNLRDFGEGPHQIVDDKPFGGGVGMVLKPDILAKALKSIKEKPGRVIITSASGSPYTQKKARQLSTLKHIVIVCGHYEGVDQRFIDKYVDEEISIGDYILTGGEIPSLIIIDSITRLVKGVLKEDATLKESFEEGLLEHPQYTRPDEFEGQTVPAVLILGDHQKVEDWKKEQSLLKTQKVRPDLLFRRNSSLKRV